MRVGIRHSWSLLVVLQILWMSMGHSCIGWSSLVVLWILWMSIRCSFKACLKSLGTRACQKWMLVVKFWEEWSYKPIFLVWGNWSVRSSKPEGSVAKGVYLSHLLYSEPFPPQVMLLDNSISPCSPLARQGRSGHGLITLSLMYSISSSWIRMLHNSTSSNALNGLLDSGWGMSFLSAKYRHLHIWSLTLD